MPITEISGKYINAKINGIDLDVVSIEVDTTKQITPTTGSLAGGWARQVVGNRAMSFTITLNLKAADPLDPLDEFRAVNIPVSDDGEEFDFEFTVDRLRTKGVRGKALATSVRITGDASGGGAQQAVISGVSNGVVTQF